MISKELLSEVLYLDCNKVDKLLGNTLGFNIEGIDVGRINIYELMWACQIWALNLGYELEINSTDVKIVFIKDKLECSKMVEDIVGSNYDYNRIFLACEWILQNNEKETK